MKRLSIKVIAVFASRLISDFSGDWTGTDQKAPIKSLAHAEPLRPLRSAGATGNRQGAAQRADHYPG